MKQLKQYLEMMDGSWGAEARYDDVVAPERGRGNWAYLCGHYKLLLGEAIKLLGGREDALRFASFHIEKCARCGEECRESSITSTDLLRDVRQGVIGPAAFRLCESIDPDLTDWKLRGNYE